MNILMLKKDKKREDNIIKDVRNLFRLNKERNNNTSKDIRNFLLDKKDEAIKGRVIRDIRKLFQREKKIITNQWKILGAKIILNMKAIEIEIKHYQLKNVLIKLGHT